MTDPHADAAPVKALSASRKIGSLRTLWILLRAPSATRRLVAMRAELVHRVETEHKALQRAEHISRT